MNKKGEMALLINKAFAVTDEATEKKVKRKEKWNTEAVRFSNHYPPEGQF